MTFFSKPLAFVRSRFPLWLRQAVKFGLVGVLNTLVDLGVYALLVHLTGLLADYHTLAKAISYAAGILNSYLWNRRWTFRSQASPSRTLLPFFAVNGLALAVNTGLMSLSFERLGLPEIVSIGIATLSTMAFNFLVSKFIIFRPRPEQNL